MKITAAEANNWHGSYTPQKVFDGNFESGMYCPEDGAAEGNFLELTLENRATISQVKIYNRYANYDRIVVTKIMVYDNGAKVGDCDSITGKYLHHIFIRFY